MFLVIYPFFVVYPISVDLGGRIPISALLPEIDCRLHYALLTKRESRRQVCFFCFFMNTRCQCPESWPSKVDPIKRMYKNWTKENFLSRDFILNAENPERVRLADLARWGSQSVQRNRFTLPARGFSHIIKLPIITSFRPGACGSTLRFFSVSVLSSNKSFAQ